MTRTVATAIVALGVSTLAAQDRPRGGFEREGRGRRPSPVLAALDADGDGALSAAEIKNAPTALRSLDQNSDNQLTADELRPRFGQGPENLEAPSSAAASDPVRTLMALDRNGDGRLAKDEVPERMQGLFERGDLDHDGVLTKEEIQKLSQARTPAREGQEGPGRPERFMRFDPLMTVLDQNRDGVLSALEIEHSAAALRNLDKDQDGQLVAEELRPNVDRGGEGGPLKPEEIAQRTIQKLDRDGDGKLSAFEIPEIMRTMFERADEDKDGLVTRDELLKVIRIQPAGPGRPDGNRRREPQ